MSEFQISSPPKDGISQVSFSPCQDHLLATSSWDKGVRVYDVTTNSIAAQWDGKAAVLTCCWNGNGTKLISGGLDRACVMFDIQTQQVLSLGAHDAAISSSIIGQDQGQDLVFTGSWDKTIKVWDLRSKTGAPTSTLNQNDKVFSMDLSGYMLVVALAGRTMQIYDIRNSAEPYQSREASLKHMIRQASASFVRCIPNGAGFASGSIEGRVAVDYFAPSPEIQAQKFSFKCHREKSNDGTEIIYPVNALAYHPSHRQTFASGGGDGIVNIWDGSQKKRLRQFPSYPTSISSLSFNKSGTLLAIASSYTFEEGEKDHPSDSIYIRPISDAEVKPKAKAK